MHLKAFQVRSGDFSQHHGFPLTLGRLEKLIGYLGAQLLGLEEAFTGLGLCECLT